MPLFNAPLMASLGSFVPQVSGDASISIVENTPTSTILATYTANGGLPVSWSLSGADASNFSINSNGELSFYVSPDYETAADRSQTVNVVATNAVGSGSKAVAVTVTDDPSDVADAIDAYIAATYSGETVHIRTSTQDPNPDSTYAAHGTGGLGPYQWSKLYDASRSTDPGFWNTAPPANSAYYGFLRGAKYVYRGIEMQEVAIHGIHSGHWSSIKNYVDAGNAQDAIFWVRWRPYANSHGRTYSAGTYNSYTSRTLTGVAAAREFWPNIVVYYHPNLNKVYQVAPSTGTVTDISSAVGI